MIILSINPLVLLEARRSAACGWGVGAVRWIVFSGVLLAASFAYLGLLLGLVVVTGCCCCCCFGRGLRGRFADSEVYMKLNFIFSKSSMCLV